jgi:hypothetical protein
VSPGLGHGVKVRREPNVGNHKGAADDDDVEALAARYFNENEEPGLRRDGVPEEGIEHLRRRYVNDVVANPEALRQLAEWAKGRRDAG